MGQKDTYVSSGGWLGQNKIQIIVVIQQSRYDTHYARYALWEKDGDIFQISRSLLPRFLHANAERARKGTAASHHIPQCTIELP